MPASTRRAARIYLLSNGLGALLLFVLTALIGRATGAAGLGLYAAVNAWILPLALLADFGLSTLAARELAADPARRRRLLGEVLALRLLIGLPLMLALGWAAPLLSTDPALAQGLQTAAPMLLILPLVSAYTAVFRAAERAWPVFWLNVGMLAAQVVLTGLAFAAGAGALTAVALNVATSGGQMLAAWILYRALFRHDTAAPRRPITPAGLWALLRAAAPFTLAALLGALQLRLGMLVLEARGTLTAVGLFSAASRPVEAARMAPNALFGALLPALSAMDSDARAAASVRRAHRLLLAFGLALVLGAALAGEAALVLIFGADFRAAALPLFILSIGLLFGMQRGLRLVYWYARREEAFANATLALGLAVQAVFSLLLIPHYGATGAAAAVALSEAAGLALAWRRWGRFRSSALAGTQTSADSG